MGAAVALVVTVSMVAAITLLPGLLGLAGTKIDKLSIHRKTHVAKPADETVVRPLGAPRRQPPGPLRHRRPRRPVRHRHPGAQHADRRARRRQRPHPHDPAHRLRPAGRRLRARVQRPDPGRRRAPAPAPTRRSSQQVHDALQADPGIAAVTAPVLNAAGDTAVLTANPTTAPQDERTDQLVRHLRADVLPATVAGTDARVSLTGQAMVTDLTDRITDRLPIFIAAVVAMSFLLLMIVFRSILVPLKAALMNLLSIAAAYGVLVAVFQWGWGNELIGLHSTMPINPFLPLIMFAILFGLSMDYEVFLLSRVREEYVATGDNHEAVVRGLSSTARVITSAALIMISVFGAFVLSDDPNGKLFGVGLAVAVLIDATLVRMVLVPATMSLLGQANWWLPAGSTGSSRTSTSRAHPSRARGQPRARARARARARHRLIPQERGGCGRESAAAAPVGIGRRYSRLGVCVFVFDRLPRTPRRVGGVRAGGRGRSARPVRGVARGW